MPTQLTQERKKVREGGECATDEPPNSSQNPQAQMPGINLEFQFSGRVGETKPSQVWGEGNILIYKELKDKVPCGSSLNLIIPSRFLSHDA